MKRALVRDRATRSAPWLPRTDEWCSAGTSDPGIPSVVLITSGASSGEVSRAACSSLSQTVCAPRFRCPVKGFVVPRRARFAEYSPCHHVCRIFHRRRRNESFRSHLGGRPSTPRWRLSSLALRPFRATQASNGGWGETSAASTSILWGRPHALAVPMNRSEYFRVSPRDEQGRKSSCRIDAGPYAPDDCPKASSSTVHAGCPSRFVLAGRSPSVST